MVAQFQALCFRLRLNFPPFVSSSFVRWQDPRTGKVEKPVLQQQQQNVQQQQQQMKMDVSANNNNNMGAKKVLGAK